MLKNHRFLSKIIFNHPSKNIFLRRLVFIFKIFSLLIFILIFTGNSSINGDLIVYPKIITPGSPPQNENVFFDYSEYSDQTPKLYIYDIHGRKVREISTLDPQVFASGWRLIWDGTDDDGNLVLPGVYIYRWQESTTVISGSIVVAR